MNMIVYLTILFSAMLSTFVFAQEDNRIPSKGYALFSKDGNFAPCEFQGNVNVATIKRCCNVVTQLLPYAGYLRTLNAIRCLNDVIPE